MLPLAQAADRLQHGQPAGHPELVAFSTWGQLVEYVKNDPTGSDLAIGVKMIERTGPRESCGQSKVRCSPIAPRS